MSTFETVHEPLEPRDVVLGRTQHVRRILPHKTRRMVGAWCFLDHYGPDDIRESGGMWVPPHPHTGLQTVTWLFEGLGRHLDSLGSDQLIHPGQLNVMTSGHGICHAEVSPPDAPATLHGVQLWVALPDEVRDSTPAAFHHLADLPVIESDGASATVFVGEVGEAVSPAPTFTPLVGVEARLEAGASLSLPARPDFEYAVLAVDQPIVVDGVRVEPRTMTFEGCGREALTIEAVDGPALSIVLGGVPFEEEIVMWWNFVARSYEELVAQREQWNVGGIAEVPERFGEVSGFDGDRLPAPPLPNLRLRPRGRAG